MSVKKVDIEYLLTHPETKYVIDDINEETMDRRAFAPHKCEVFSSDLIVLEDQPQYSFAINREAENKLPDIINNHVQKLLPCERGCHFDNQAEKINKNIGIHGNASQPETVKGNPDGHGENECRFFKKRNIGIVFSGGPAPGGHNVIAGIYDAALKANPDSKIFGFILGPNGILENRYVEIKKELVDRYRNMGGFTMIKTGRTKIDSKHKMELSRQTCKGLNLDALVIVGGDDSNTNAAFLAQELKSDGIQVIGIPKTIDGDIQVKTENGVTLCAISFGFHSAARAFSQNISNLCTDASSDLKYWHVCKVMGRVASHLALESALQTHANFTLIGEELADYVDNERIAKAEAKNEIDYTAFGMTLRHLSRLICDAIVKRAAHGKNYGVMIIPEGVLEFINEIQLFIIKLNTIIADYNQIHDLDFHAAFPSLDAKLEYLRRLSRGITEKSSSPIWNSRDDELFNDLPSFFQEGLLVERDTHGNFQFSQVKTEKIIMDMVKDYLHILKEKGEYKVGIEADYYRDAMKMAKLDPDLYGNVIFKNYKTKDIISSSPPSTSGHEKNGEDSSRDLRYYLINSNIISMKTLKQSIVNAGIISEDEKIPETITEIYKKSVPNIKTQTHFYGYDGRGSHPTKFDCNYTYNLGMTAFSLIANGATGQMAVIKNLEHSIDQWEPMGIPIAKLMHLEERKGKLALVMEKNIVDINSNAFKVLKAMRKKWLAANHGEDHYRKPAPIRFRGNSEEDKPLMLVLNAISSPDKKSL
ncbi:Putative phosphofructokinase [Desulfamplus magnetovallimortis]|uniref:Putative phosphofructokinase n=1 Tax=Desulfamplus magnetovallimortis TaxID=1246637 RepID=A0A1W1H4L0_9BACT|nr:6-phosphofructokinase [Desulfamplus magnetovallimortis]SLM27409.1 Putative phosphofructokinase [Desulfamplus magnetovallimortis]